ncbi:MULTISPECIES: triphosphoribosyl-dephospho-CoA synthase [unclassified Xanthobacter]|uniref:triphosphoribosyl-dephospho-CoA synthase n=1 Tax=unclassified Xanthobacter TaxID=2623496 RepID=UPI001EDEE9F3
MSPDAVARLFAAACRAELSALKPGNVHVFAAGHGMDVSHFERAAEAAAAVIARPGLAVGERIRRAVDASLAVAGCNTNLGIILLTAPLVAAALEAGATPLRDRLRAVLSHLTQADAQEAFHAIASANPGGLGAAPEADVHAPARLDLRAAMAIAAHRDRIAAQYTNDYADVFELAMPHLLATPFAPAAIEDAYLALLARWPDSHIARKFGAATAEQVCQEAQALRCQLAGATTTERRAALAAGDASLKARGLNPGTTADLTVAAILAAALSAPA